MDNNSQLMLLLMRLGSDIYGLDVMDVLEVIPRIEARPIPHAPDYVIGLISYRGIVVPLIDLKMLMKKEPCMPWLSTRIIITECPCSAAAMLPAARLAETAGRVSVQEEGKEPAKQGRMLLAMLGERVTETVEVDASQLQSTGIEVSENSYLGKMAIQDKRMIQILRLDHILPYELKEMLARAARSR